MKTKKQVMGAHWEQTQYSKLYQLYRRVEDVARDLETRRQQDMKVTKRLVEELYGIATKLRCWMATDPIAAWR